MRKLLPPLLALCFASPFFAENGPDSFDQLTAQAATARAANDIPKAVNLYRQALDMRPNWAEGWWFLGTLSYDGDQFADCRDALGKLIRLPGGDASPALTMLGLCEYSTHDYAGALDHLQRGLKASDAGLDPSIETVARFHQALLLTKTGMFDPALQLLAVFAKAHAADDTLTQAIGLAALRIPLVPEELPPDRRELITAAGNATYLWMRGNLDQAEAGLRSLAAANPRAENVHYLYGSFLVDRRPEDAILEFRRELQNNPRNPAAQAMLALQLYRNGKYDEAMPLATAAAAAAPTLPKAQLAVGLLQARSGEAGAGVDHLRTACELDPSDFECHAALATALSKAGRAEESRRERFLAMALVTNSAPHADR